MIATLSLHQAALFIRVQGDLSRAAGGLGVMRVDRLHQIPELDGLRAISILIVLLGHSFPKVFPAAPGVEVFFAISGFLICTLLIREWQSNGSINIRYFFARRVLRLYPELIVYCIVLVTVCVFEGWRIYMVQLAGAVLYFSNYLQAFFQIPSPVNFEMRPLWSLAVEEHFYLIFPFLVIMSRGNVRLLLMGLFFGFVGMFVWRHIARHVIGLPGPYLEYATECRADAIIAGCLFALMLSSSKGKDLLEYLDDNGGLILSSAVALLLFSIVVRHEEFRAVARWTVQSIGAALLVASCAFGGQIRRLRSWLASAPMRFFGRISYSVYLYHLLIFKLVKTHLGHDWRFFPINIGASVVVASLSYLLIEDPLKPLRRRFGSNVRSVRSTSDVPVKAVPQSTIDRGVPIGAAEPDQLPAG